MTQPTFQERAQGALMGAFIGDALALGPHWYYDLQQQWRDYGTWIDDYTDPQPGRYHEGLKAGQLSQCGYLLKMLITSLVENGDYSHEDFCNRLDTELFPQLDGSPYCGPGGYTSQSIREAWQKRVVEKASWDATGGGADTTEAMERTLALGVRYAFDPTKLADATVANTVITQNDNMLVAMTVAFGAVLAQLVRGHAFDTSLSGILMDMVKSGQLPFHAVTQGKLQPPKKGEKVAAKAGQFSSPDALLSPSFIARAAQDPDVSIDPPWKVSLVYGMPCAVYHILPAAYYLAAYFTSDFESGVLHAVNGGGQNQARAILTGALCGAQAGIEGIPQRFLDGLEDGKALLALSARLGEQADAGE